MQHQHFEVEIDDDNETDSSFVLLYQLSYEKKYLFKNYLNEQEIDHDLDYYFYEVFITTFVFLHKYLKTKILY